MDSRAYLDVLVTESERFLAALRQAPLDARVPSCPDWSAADLAWHLGEVQYFWAAIVSGLLPEPDGVEDPERPPDEQLHAWCEQQAAALVAALSARAPEEVCWSWHDDGHTVGWVTRRQAHEALIHRVDAELAAGVALTGVDPALAADGVDEVLTYFVAGVPAWGRFDADGTTVAVRGTDVAAEHLLEFGRFTGTSPDTGRTYDLDAALLLPSGGGADAMVAGRAWALDLWLWGRGGGEALTVTGTEELAGRLRALAAESTV